MSFHRIKDPGGRRPHKGSGWRLKALMLLAVGAVAQAHLEIELDLARFPGVEPQTGFHRPSTLLAPTGDVLHPDMLGDDGGAALLFGQLKASAARDMCRLWQGLQLTQEVVVYRSTDHPHGSPHDHGSLQVSRALDCPDDTDVAAPQLAAVSASGLNLVATCLPNEEFCLLWLVGPEVNELQHSHGIESEPPQLTCGHNQALDQLACFVVGPLGEAGCARAPPRVQHLCKPSMLEVKVWPAKTDLSFAALQTELTAERVNPMKPSVGSISNFVRAEIADNAWASHVAAHKPPRKLRP